MSKLPSGRWRARYWGPDGGRHSAPATFSAKADAEAWLVDERRLIERGEWTPPARRTETAVAVISTTLAEYAARWMTKAKIGDGTRVGYERALRLRILPALGGRTVASISRADVAAWWDSLDHGAERACDIAFALLRTIMRAAVDDGLAETDPCRVRGAGRGSRRRSAEPLTPEQVLAVADAMPPRWRIGVLLGAWCALRSGEVRELRRDDVDLERGVITVARSVKRAGVHTSVGAPKTEAGRRSVAIPAPLLDVVRQHLLDHAQIGPDGLLLWNRAGAQVDDRVWRRAWIRACEHAGISEHTFHDLRRTGLTYAAVAGATIRELQAMAGHTTPQVAMRYQEVAAGHMAEVVSRLGEVIVLPDQAT